MASTLNDTNISDVYKKLVFTMEDSATEADLWATQSDGDDRKITGFASALSFTGRLTAEVGVLLGNNILYASDGGTAIQLDTGDNVFITGDLTVTGNSIKTGDTSVATTAITLSGANVEVVGDLTITGGNITNAITCDSTVTTTGLLTANASVVVGADADGTDRTITFGHSTLKSIVGIDDSADRFVINTDASFDGTIADNDFSIDASGNCYLLGDLTVTGNDIKSSSATALTLSGANVAIPGTLTMTGNIIMAASTDLRFATQMDIHNGSSSFISFDSSGIHANNMVFETAGRKVSPLIQTAATATLTVGQSGKIIGVDTTSNDIVLTLPGVADGLNYKIMIVKKGSYDLEIKSPSATNYFYGGVVHLDNDSSSDATQIATVVSDNNSNDFLTLTVAECGTIIDLVCNGTLWYVSGTVNSITAPAFGDASGL
jgi:hypothetical protein